ncbi:MAG: oligosaccharide flippase family protein [Ferruginibacter sp.]
MFSVSEGIERSKKYKKNTLILILCQILSLGSSLLLVPIVLKYLGVSEYGIWITLTTIVGWFSFFDIGLGNGLRNKYAEAKALGSYTDINYYVSTTFYILVLISTIIFILYLIANIFVDWTVVLAAPISIKHDLNILVTFVVGTFCLRFIFNIIPVLLTADQDPAISAILNLGSNVLSLVGVYFLGKTSFNTLLYFGICLSVTQLLPFLIAFFIFFKTRYKEIVPKLSNFRKSYIDSILNLGLRYFFIQITGLFLFQTNIFIIAHICSLEDVTKFNIAYKYLSILYIFFTTILGPLWSASTEAYVKNDFEWIKKWMNIMKIIWWGLVVCGIFMILGAPLVYKLWLGKMMSPDMLLLSLLFLYFASLTRTSMFRYFMNGAGKIKLQFYITAIQAILHIPLAIVFGKMIGIYGILIAMIIWNITNIIWEPLQYKKIISNKATGIWNS